MYLAKPMPRPRPRLPRLARLPVRHARRPSRSPPGRAGPSDARAGTRPDRPSPAAASSSMKDFDREHVGVGAERAQRRDPDRHLRDEVVHDPLVREVVERDGVAVAAAGRLRDAARRRRASAARPDTRPPARWCRRSLCGRIEWVLLHNSYCQSAIWPSASSDGLDAASTIAAPYGSQANSSSRIHCSRTGRPGSGARQQRRVERDVVGAVVAVAARALGVDAADRRSAAS